VTAGAVDGLAKAVVATPMDTIRTRPTPNPMRTSRSTALGLTDSMRTLICRERAKRGMRRKTYAMCHWCATQGKFAAAVAATLMAHWNSFAARDVACCIGWAFQAGGPDSSAEASKWSVIWLPFQPTRTRPPCSSAPNRSSLASGRLSSSWSKRASGRAPLSGS